MDLATVIGIIAGVFLLFATIIMGGSIVIFINVPSALVVLGGTICAILIAYPLKDCLRVIAVIKNAFTSKEKEAVSLIMELIKLAMISKQKGKLSLGEHARRMKDPFIEKGIQMVSDQLPADAIQSVLTLELNSIITRHRMGQNIMQDAGTYAPAFGMIGTLIGLVQMLAALDDPKTIGPKMAVALITTFYGAIIANLLCIPIKKKLIIRSDMEKTYRKLCIEGIVSLANDESPLMIEDKLKSTLSVGQQQDLVKKKKSMK